eukprot:scaffold245422_cov88-Attheya_sp.AAC.1
MTESVANTSRHDKAILSPRRDLTNPSQTSTDPVTSDWITLCRAIMSGNRNTTRLMNNRPPHDSSSFIDSPKYNVHDSAHGR